MSVSATTSCGIPRLKYPPGVRFAGRRASAPRGGGPARCVAARYHVRTHVHACMQASYLGANARTCVLGARGVRARRSEQVGRGWRAPQRASAPPGAAGGRDGPSARPVVGPRRAAPARPLWRSSWAARLAGSAVRGPGRVRGASASAPAAAVRAARRTHRQGEEGATITQPVPTSSRALVYSRIRIHTGGANDEKVCYSTRDC